MAEFYGSVEGSGGEVHRLGGKKSGIQTRAAAWTGAVNVSLRLDDAGRVLADIDLVPHRGVGVYKTIAHGLPVDGKPRARNTRGLRGGI